MKFIRIAWFVVVAGTALSAQERRESRVDMSGFFGRFDLEEVEFDFNGTTTFPDAEIDRDRIGARFAFGRESVRGFFHVFYEGWEAEFLDGSDVETIDSYGLGGGVTGAPGVNDAGSAVRVVIPYQADISAIAGFEEGDIGGQEFDAGLLYFELQADVGVGIDWLGLRPSAGVQISSLYGLLAFDEDLFDGDSDDDEFDLSGTNFGAYVELAYKHPDFPMYGKVRVGGGDFSTAEFYLGAAW